MLTIPNEIKDLLHLDSCKKNIRIHFPGGERSDICNDLIVMDSVKFTESLCSQDQLKFGLCESPVFECEVVGVGNIKGATIEVSCEVYCSASVTGAEWRTDLQHYIYSIPYGIFLVTDCKRQSDMNHRRIQAYGGTARLRVDNEMIIQKGIETWSSQTAYTPDVFATIMMLSGSKSRLDQATYTELETLDFDDDYYRIKYVYTESGYGDTYYLYCDVIAYEITSSNQNDLFYFEAENPYKSINEVWNDIFSGFTQTAIKDRLLSQMQKKVLFGPGTKYISNDTPTQKGSYIYPYQEWQYDPETLSRWYIFMPYKIYLGVQRLGSMQVISSSVFRDKAKIKLYQVNYDNYPKVTFTVPRNIPVETVPITYAFDTEALDYIKLFDKVLELSGMFGYLDRFGMLKLINIQQRFGLKPASSLYPDDDVYPEGVTGGKLLPEDYQTCWYDDDYTTPFGAVVCQYKNTSNVDCEYTYYLPGFSADSPVNTYQIYYLDSNDIIDNSTWTAQQIEAMCAVIASNIQGVTYMPVEFVGRGLPYVEAGDTFEILTPSSDSITTIVLNRTITGEQVLTDSYKSV